VKVFCLAEQQADSAKQTGIIGTMTVLDFTA